MLLLPTFGFPASATARGGLRHDLRRIFPPQRKDGTADRIRRRCPARRGVQAPDLRPGQQPQLLQPRPLRRGKLNFAQNTALSRHYRIQSHPPHFHGRTPLSLVQDIHKCAVS